MSHRPPIDVDCKSPPFDQFVSIQWLAAARSGHASAEHARHQLYVARDKRSRANVLIKVTSKPGIVYEQDLTNEIASLSTINRERAIYGSSQMPWFHRNRHQASNLLREHDGR